jgi:ribosomal protein S18 acetylase RimI-like enzyme
MSVEIQPFSREHLDQAAALLARRQRTLRLETPAMPERFENPAESRTQIEQALSPSRTTGAAAFRAGEMAGYLIGTLALGRPALRPRAGWVEYAGHSVQQDDGDEIYRMLYAAVAPEWVGRGAFAHYITVPATDRQALDAWFSLGYGQFHALGLRDLVSRDRTHQPPAIDVREAGPEDSHIVFAIRRALALHHTRSPVLEPYPPEADGWLRANTAERLGDARFQVMLAVRVSETLGLFSLSPVEDRGPMVLPDRCLHIDEAYTEPDARGTGAGTALLESALARARAGGYAWCSVSWRTSNLSADRFWRRNGFRPLYYRLVRAIDPRIAWARPPGEVVG